jgi:hydroxymethylpyrimidine/phosphomethylpyrimidine kinase
VLVTAQLDAVLAGFAVRAAKTGMLWSRAIIAAVAARLATVPRLQLVVDPVFIATSGARLISARAVSTLADSLFPLAALITPNIPEAQQLSGHVIRTADDAAAAARALYARFGVPVLLKGGHGDDNAAIDILAGAGDLARFAGPRVPGVNTHGSGCTLAAAITAYLALGLDLHAAIAAAKRYISGSLAHALLLADDVRVINHFWNRPVTNQGNR